MAKPSLIADISGLDNALREMALLDIRIAEANVRRSDEMLEAEARFTAAAGLLVGRRKLLFDECERYYRANRKELETGKKKSIDLQFGRAGIKDNPPELRLLAKRTWDQVLEALYFAEATEYIRTKDEVDKQALKASGYTEDELAEFGVKIHQKETFFVEPKAPKSTATEEAA